MKIALITFAAALLMAVAAPTASHADEPCQDVTFELGRPYWITGGHSPGERVTLARFHTPGITGHTVVPSSLNLRSVRSGTDLHVGPVTLSDVEATPNQVTVGAPFVAGDLVEVAVTLSDDPRQSVDQVSLTCQHSPATTSTTATTAPTTTLPATSTSMTSTSLAPTSTAPSSTSTSSVPTSSTPTTSSVPASTSTSTPSTSTTQAPSSTTTTDAPSPTSTTAPTSSTSPGRVATTAPELPARRLPATGDSATALALGALSLIVLGALALFVVRRPR